MSYIDGKHFTTRVKRRAKVARGAKRTSFFAGLFSVLLGVVLVGTAVFAFAAVGADSGIEVTASTRAEAGKDNVYNYDVTYEVTATVPSDKSFNTNKGNSYVYGSVDGAVTQSDNWSAGEETADGSMTYTTTVTVSEATNVELKLHATYNLINDATTTSKIEEISTGTTLTVDKNPPRVTAVMNQVVKGNSNNVDTFGAYPLKATIAVDDATFDYADIYTSGGRGNRKIGSISDGETSAEITCITENGQNNISSFYVLAYDKAGNKAKFSYGDSGTKDSEEHLLAGKSFEVDTTSPSISVTLNGEINTGIYNSEVSAVVEIRAAVGRSLGEPTFADGNDNWTLDEEAKTDSYQKWTRTFTNDGVYTINVKVPGGDWYKWWPTEDSGDITFRIDTEKPEIVTDLTFDSEPAAVTNKYYSSARTATLTVKDASFTDQDAVRASLDFGEGPDPTEWSFAQDADGATKWTVKVTFESDGDYVPKVTCTDAAGNLKEGAALSEFTIDTTAPEKPVVSFDNNEVQNDKYYKADRTAEITVTEHNFDSSLITINTNGTYDSNSWSKSEDGNVHTLVVVFDKDGEYDLTITGTDKAGNEMPEYTNGAFVVDKTAPAISVTWDNESALNGKYYKAARNATITVTEKNFNPDFIEIETNGAKGTWFDNGDVHTTTVSFTGDGTYNLSVNGKDLAGNAMAKYKADEFVIDKTVPVIKVAYDNDAAAAEKNGETAYYNAKRTATVTVTELNFSEDDFTVNAANGDATVSAWTNNGDVHTKTVTFPESASDYRLTVSGSDLAGNAAKSYDSKPFVIDLTDPKVAISLSQATTANLGGSDYFDQAPVATITVVEHNFKESATTVTIDGKVYNATWTSDGDTRTAVLPQFAEGTGHSINIVTADWAERSATNPYGKNTTDSTGKSLGSSTFIVDLTAPTATNASVDHNPSNSYADGSDTSKYFFNASTVLTVSLKDNIALQSAQLLGDTDGYVGYTTLAAGQANTTFTVAFVDGHSFDKDITLRVTDVAGNYRDWLVSPTGQIKLASGTQGSDNQKIDQTPNYSTELLQDTVAPVVSLSGVEAGAFYNADQTVAMSVNELNIPYLKAGEPGQVVFTVNKTEGNASRAASSWTRAVTELAGEGESWGLSQAFNEDGHYTVYAQVTDPAKNSASAEIGEFTIDKTAPTIEVTWDNESVLNGKYYKEGRTATITVTEHNFDPSLITITTNGVIGGWSDNGDVHTITVSCTTDGVYNLSVSGKDQAGNAMPDYAADEFVVDLTKPTIEFSGIEKQTAYNDEVPPVITFTDEANFDPSACTFTLVGTKNGEVSYDAAIADTGLSRTVSYADFTRDPDFDDIYTLSATMTDLAGNTAEDSITFSVNRFGSTYRWVNENEFTEYNDSAKDVVIEEINVCGDGVDMEAEDALAKRAAQHSVTVTAGTNVSTIDFTGSAQKTGFTITAGSSTDEQSNGWSVYTYRVASGNFTKDGLYNVSVQSNDAATNINSSSNYYNRAAEKTTDAQVEFVLDTTDPVIQNLNIEPNGVYETDLYEGSFTVVENVGLASVTVMLDGTEVEATADQYGNYTFEVPAISFTDRSLDITAIDLAGNGSDYEDGVDSDSHKTIAKFNVTTNIFELHLLWVIIGTLVVVGGVVLAIFLAKRNKDDEEKRTA